MRARLLAVVALVALVGSSSLASGATARSHADPLTIYAAASLTEVFKALDPSQRYSFAGSNTLETQIRNGAPADVFASAAPLNTQRLYKAGIVDKPVTFTSNRLVLIVPKSNPAGITSVYDLGRTPVKLVVAGAAVPVGGYTRTVLRRMGLTGVLSKVVSVESDVKAVTGKVALGQADAGFVYATDARAVSGDVTAVRIPAWAQPRVRYEIAVVSKSPNKAAAQAWVKMRPVREGPEGAARRGLPPASEGIVVNRLFRGLLVLATALALGFLLLPIIAIFLRVPPGELVSALQSDVAKDALVVTFETNLIALALILLLGTPTAYWAATRRSRLRDLVVTLIELPLVLPPAVAGIGLLAAFVDARENVADAAPITTKHQHDRRTNHDSGRPARGTAGPAAPEGQLVKALPKMAKAAKSDLLRLAFEKHVDETRGHVDRLKEAFDLLGVTAKPKPCKGMAGLLDEGYEVIDEGDDKDDIAADLAVIASAQRWSTTRSPCTARRARWRDRSDGPMWRSCWPNP